MLNTIMNHSDPQASNQTTLSSVSSSLNNTKIFKPPVSTVINLESEADNNPSIPSTIASDKSTTTNLGSTSLTPIDLTRSNSHSVWMSNTNTMSNSIATSNPNSNSSSPLVPKLVSSSASASNISSNISSISNISNISDRKRRFQDPSTDPMIGMHVPTRKRQKLENGTAAPAAPPMSTLNLHAHTVHNMNHMNNRNNRNNGNNPAFQNSNMNPLTTLQQQLLAGKRQSLYNTHNNNQQRKQIDITLVQLVNYLKTQFAKLQQQNQNKLQRLPTPTMPSNAPSSTASNASSIPPQHQNLQHIINAMQMQANAPGQQPQKQQMLINMMNNNNNNNTKTALLQSLLNLKLKQQQQQQQQHLLNAMAMNANANANNVLPLNDNTKPSVFAVSNNGNNNHIANNGHHNNLAKLMANLQNIQKMNNMNTMNNSMNINMMLHKNSGTPPNYSSFAASSKSLTNSTSPRRNIMQSNEPISLLSDDDDGNGDGNGEQYTAQQMNYIHTNHPLNHKKKKSNKTKHKNKVSKEGKKRKKHKKHKQQQQMMTNSDHTDMELLDENGNRNKKRKRSPSTTSTTASDTLSNNINNRNNRNINRNNNRNIDNGNESDESYKAYNINTTTTKRRQRRKRMCNIDKEFDEEERMIKYKEDMMHLSEPISHNAYIVAYAESLHLDDMKLKNNEVFPILRQMPRAALIKYCDYYKLRHSKRSKDNRLLQIVTKHFIVHNREKNQYRTIQDMEQDLFWHSVCNNHKQETQEQSDSP